MRQMTNFDLARLINGLVNKVEKLEHKLDGREFIPFDATQFIGVDMAQLKPLWKLKNIYYDTPSKLYAAAVVKGYSKTKPAFRTLCKAFDRQEELWELEINLVWAAPLVSGRLITSEGFILTSKIYTRILGDYRNNYTNIMVDGEKFNLNLGRITYKRFVDPTYELKNVHYLNNDFTHSRIDNLAPVTE